MGFLQALPAPSRLQVPGLFVRSKRNACHTGYGLHFVIRRAGIDMKEALQAKNRDLTLLKQREGIRIKQKEY